MYPTVFNQNLELKIGKWIRIFWLSVIVIRRQNMFKLVSKYTPSGDQPQAIDALVKGINEGKKHQVYLVLQALVKHLL